MTSGAAWAAVVPVPARVAEIRARLGGRVDAAGFDAALDEAIRSTAAAPGIAPSTVAQPPAWQHSAAGAGAYTATRADAGDVAPVALRYLGVPYVWGGNDPATGLDCSGFTKLVYGSLGVSLPRVSTDQATMGEPVTSLATARPGDLLAFGTPVDHVAIYLGDGRMVHAAGTGKGVRIDDVDRPPTAIRRLFPASGATTAAPRTTGAPSMYQPLFDAAGARHGVDPALLSAVARAESGYHATAVSHAGALGLMQFMPATAAGLGIDPLDPVQAVDGAARYLAQQLTTFGSVELALAAYNAGPGAVARHGGVPPFAETQAYVRKVLAHHAELARTIGASA